jgi:hypothetical protein
VSVLTPTTVWRLAPALVLALDEHLGPPVDSYVNGTQTWLVPMEGDDPDGDPPIVEWRLHPVAGFEAPSGCSHYDLWDEVVGGVTAGDPDALPLGEERRPLGSLWDGLECFPAYGDEVEPATLARAATDRIGIPPDAAGLVDHERIGVAWEHAKGRVSLVDMLLAELAATDEPATDEQGGRA